MSTWKILWKLAGPARFGAFGGAALRVVQSLFLGGTYAAAIFVVLRIVQQQPISDADVRIVLLLCSVSIIGQLIAGYFAAKLSWLAAFQAVAEMRLALLDHFRHVPIATIGTTRLGDSTNVITTDLAAIEEFLSESFPRLGQAVGSPLIIVFAVSLQDPVLGATLAASIILALPIASWSGRRIGELSDQRQATQAMASSRMIDTVASMPVLRVFSTRPAVLDYFHTAVEQFRSISVTMVHRIVVPSVATALVILLGIPLVLQFIGLSTSTTPELAAMVLVVVLSLYQPILGVLGSAESWRLCQASLRRVQNILHMPTQLQPHSSRQPLIDTSIEFANISYSYPDGTAALTDISFQIPAGNMVAIVGSSGAGKTTVLNLLARLNDPTTGEIRIGGIPLTDIPDEQLFELISVVFQQVQLFPGTVAENIALGRPDTPREHIIAAAQAACAHEFIEQLPQGYDTLLGEGGAGLSGGQQQRLSIARALLKDSPIVVLDEPTSAVDPGTELAVNQGLSALLSGRTVVVVAHQLTTISAADSIIVLDHGRIAELGNHADLLAQHGSYAQLWNALSQANAWTIGSE